jgi:hypothetical protein
MSPIDNPLARLIGAAEEAADDDVRATTFVRGLALGALVGAAIAGSTIWQRRHALSMKARTDAEAAAPDPVESGTAETPSRTI